MFPHVHELSNKKHSSDSSYYQCVDFWECSSEGNILDNPFEYHGGEGLIDARIYFPPGNGNGRNVTTDPLLKACPEQSQVKRMTPLVGNPS